MASCTPYIKVRLVGLDGNRCCYCDLDFNGRPDQKTLEHIRPISKGGSTKHWSNFALACKKCNVSKGNRLLSETAFPHSAQLREYLRDHPDATAEDAKSHARSRGWPIGWLAAEEIHRRERGGIKIEETASRIRESDSSIRFRELVRLKQLELMA